MSVLHATYQACIKPYVKQNSVILEIAPGRGGWTKAFLGAAEVWRLDALSAEHNAFWQHIGPANHMHYFQVNDFRLQHVAG